jgi:enoyl-CoA hydratase/carnithine racemase
MDFIYEDMFFEKEDGIAIVTFNRPEKLNALSEGIRKGLRQAISDVDQDDDMRAMIITGAGERGFCSGADVSEGTRPGQEGTRTYRKGPLSIPVTMLKNMDKPVIGAINGVAAGAGFGIALACDILIASENASFISVFIRVGLAVEWGVSYWLPKIVGKAKALEIMWTGDRVDAREAEKIGLVSRVVPAADLLKEAKAFAARLAKQPPMSIEFIKRLTYEGYDDTLTAHLGYEQQCAGILIGTKDREEGFRAFREKRPAKFTGM